MVKRMISFGSSETDALVMRWLADNGIDHKLVRAYAIERSRDDNSTITLTMHFNDRPAQPAEQE